MITEQIPKDSHTEAMTDSKGNVIGTKTTTKNLFTGATTETKMYTTGENAGASYSETKDKNGETISQAVKWPNGATLTNVKEGSGLMSTLTKPDGTVTTSKFDDAKATKLSSRSVSHPDGSSETITFDPSGKPRYLTIKDSQGKTTSAIPDGKGGFTSEAKGQHGRVTTTAYDKDGKLTGETVKNKHGEVVKTTTLTPDGKGGSTSVTKDRHGNVVSTTVYDKTGKVISQSGKKEKMGGGHGLPPWAEKIREGLGLPPLGHKEKMKPGFAKDEIPPGGKTGSGEGDKKPQTGISEQIKMKRGPQDDLVKNPANILKKPGEAVGLNPQPLPPKDVGGKVLMKEKPKVQDWGVKAGEGAYQKYQKYQKYEKSQ